MIEAITTSGQSVISNITSITLADVPKTPQDQIHDVTAETNDE